MSPASRQRRLKLRGALFESNANAHRLLILACSRLKKADTGCLPAVERYDGPAFRVLRKFLVDRPAEANQLDIRILSAKFGLIPAEQPIPYYDKVMTARQAVALNPKVLAELEQLLEQGNCRNLLLNIGRSYVLALAGYEALISRGMSVTLASGSSGRRQSILRDWLRGEPQSPPPVISRGQAQIRGRVIALTPEQILEKACHALASGDGAAQTFQSWYVQVGERRVSPKWLVHQLTGLAVGEFHSDEARRVLQQLGVSVCRV